MNITNEKHDAGTTAFVEFRADVSSDDPNELVAHSFLPPHDPFVVDHVLLVCRGDTMETLDYIKVYAWGEGSAARKSAEWTSDGALSRGLRSAPQFVFDLFRNHTEHYDLLTHLTQPIRETRS